MICNDNPAMISLSSASKSSFKLLLGEGSRRFQPLLRLDLEENMLYLFLNLITKYSLYLSYASFRGTQVLTKGEKQLFYMKLIWCFF